MQFSPVDWINWLVTGTGTLVGAFLGSYLADWFARRLSKQETISRRAVLLEALKEELGFISTNPPIYAERQVFYSDPVRLIVPQRLLDGETLDYIAHADLIRSLLTLQMAISKYNDFSQTATLAQSLGNLPDTAYKQLFDTMIENHNNMLLARRQLVGQLSLLPANREDGSTSQKVR